MPYESDLAGNISFFKSRPKPIDERPSESVVKSWGKGNADTTRVVEVSEAILGSQECTRKNTLMAKTSTKGLMKRPRYR